MFRSKRPSSGVHVVVTKESAAHCNAVQIIGCFRYVDDILLIYGERKTNIGKTLGEFNEEQPIIKFSIEKESHNSIHLLDLSIHRGEREIEFAICSEPSQVDIIRNDSCYPHEHKILSATKQTD
jgi:hypothetical protein